MYFLVFTLSLKLAAFAVIFGVAFFTVTFTDAVDALKMSDPPYVIFALYVFGVSVAILIFTWPFASVVYFLALPMFTVNTAFFIAFPF